MTAALNWFGIVRLGLVQASIGAIVVLATSTLNRVMVVELALPAIVPGLLVALHYAVQILRPAWGFGSDRGGRLTPWIAGGVAVLAAGGIGAALATVLMATHPACGLVLAVAAYLAIGGGVGAAGTSLLVLLAKRVAPARRGAAATIVWLMMMLGFIAAATAAGRLLDPFSPTRLVLALAAVASVALVATLLAVRGLEGAVAAEAPGAVRVSLAVALRQVWAERRARNFAAFVFASMLAYSAQELVLEPFAGAVFHLPPAASAQLAGVLHGGVLAGMLLMAGATLAGGRRFGALRHWTVGGCAGSAVAILALAGGGLIMAESWPLRASVFVLGAANGAFAVSAIGAMMGLAGEGRSAREGVRMGIWGAAQAIAFALGGLLGTGLSDVFRAVFASPAAAYACVFAVEAGLFLFAAVLAARVFAPARAASPIGWAAHEGSRA